MKKNPTRSVIMFILFTAAIYYGIIWEDYWTWKLRLIFSFPVPFLIAVIYHIVRSEPLKKND